MLETLLPCLEVAVGQEAPCRFKNQRLLLRLKQKLQIHLKKWFKLRKKRKLKTKHRRELLLPQRLQQLNLNLKKLLKIHLLKSKNQKLQKRKLQSHLLDKPEERKQSLLSQMNQTTNLELKSKQDPSYKQWLLSKHQWQQKLLFQETTREEGAVPAKTNLLIAIQMVNLLDPHQL